MKDMNAASGVVPVQARSRTACLIDAEELETVDLEGPSEHFHDNGPLRDLLLQVEARLSRVLRGHSEECLRQIERTRVLQEEAIEIIKEREGRRVRLASAPARQSVSPRPAGERNGSVPSAFRKSVATAFAKRQSHLQGNRVSKISTPSGSQEKDKDHRSPLIAHRTRTFKGADSAAGIKSSAPLPPSGSPPSVENNVPAPNLFPHPILPGAPAEVFLPETIETSEAPPLCPTEPPERSPIVPVCSSFTPGACRDSLEAMSTIPSLCAEPADEFAKTSNEDNVQREGTGIQREGTRIQREGTGGTVLAADSMSVQESGTARSRERFSTKTLHQRLLGRFAGNGFRSNGTTFQKKGTSWGKPSIIQSRNLNGLREEREAEDDGDKVQVSFFARIMDSPWFDVMSAVLIALNTVCIGLETDWMARNPFAGNNQDFDNLRLSFCIAFTLELVIRIVARPREFLTSPEDQVWNLFDTVLVLSSLFELLFHFVDTGGAASTSRVIRILRIVRITRAMRIGRVLRYARTFRQIAYSLQASMGTLFWALLMVFLIVYCFAICFCQAATEHLVLNSSFATQDELPEQLDRLRLNFSDVPMSLLQLFMSMTGGRNWGEVMEPLVHASFAYSAIFLVFISLVFFGVLNIVTAIFVDSAMQSQQHYKDLLIQEKSLKNQLYTQHLRGVFTEIDKDGSGSITGDEMEYFLRDPVLNLYLEAIDVFPNDARALFCLLDVDDSGEVNIDEFCQGCLRLKGEAKSFDIHCLIYNVEKLHWRMTNLIETLETLDLSNESS